MNLDEVVVVGYGTQRKSDVTGSISVISGEDMLARPSFGALVVSFNVVNHSGAKPLMFINDRDLVIPTTHGEHFVTFTVDFEQKAVRISNGSHLAEFPLSAKLEQMIVNRIYNSQKDNFHDKIVF
ncbi:MAG: hypothetical protein LBU76_01635 [Azoarcus sp.]|nr:hypothetical protein [Azoarcus sp.]